MTGDVNGGGPNGTQLRRIVLAVGIALLLGSGVTAFSIAAAPGSRGSYLVAGLDFRALYCAGFAVNVRRNPLHVEPLRSCERGKPPLLRKTWAVVPAPYPAYALALFALFARLPYTLAKALWLGVLAATVALCVPLLARLSRWPAWIVAVVLVPTALLGNLVYGSTPPLAFAGLTVAGFTVLSRKALVAPALAFAMIDPHLALPSVLVAYIRGAPSARRWILWCVAALAVIAFWTTGPLENLEYLRITLPEQARAEVFDNYQYSLTHALAILGVRPSTALAAGSASYAIIAALAIAFACREPSRDEGPARAIVVPVAAAALGGAYMHYQEITLALPCAFVLARSATDTLSRALLTVAFCGLLFSPEADNARVALIPYVAACGAVGASLWPSARSLAATVVAFAALVFSRAIHALPHSALAYHAAGHAASRPPPASLVAGQAPFSPVWGAYLATTNYDLIEDARLIAFKIPVWIGLTTLLVLAFIVQRRARSAAVASPTLQSETSIA